MQLLTIENLLGLNIFLSFCIFVYAQKASKWESRCLTLEELRELKEESKSDTTDNLLEECRYWRRKDNVEAAEFAKDAREYH